MSAAAERDQRVAGIKVPPHSIEAEQAVLGALLLQASGFWQIGDRIGEADFYRGDHRLVWRTIAAMIEDDQAVDVLTVGRALENAGTAGRGVDTSYLAELVEQAPGVANLGQYAQIIAERSKLRGVIDAANRMADAAFNPEGRKASEIVDEAEREVSALGDDRTGSGGPRAMVETLKDYVDTIDARVAGGQTRLNVGLRDFDAHHGGFDEDNLVILAGRPGMGKTTVGMAWAENVALAGGRSLVFSLEMSESELMDRTMARMTGIEAEVLRSGRFADGDWPRFTKALSVMRGTNLQIDDTGGLHVDQVRARARRAHRLSPLSMIFVDYLQLLHGTGKDGYERTSYVSKTLKALAKELHVPVVAGAQLNRSVESRPITNRRPVNSDLRESGSLEQDADRIVMCYRHEVYDPDTPRTGVLELITTKFRTGRPGTQHVLCDLSRSTLTDTPEGWVLPAQKQPRFSGKSDDDDFDDL